MTEGAVNVAVTIEWKNSYLVVKYNSETSLEDIKKDIIYLSDQIYLTLKHLGKIK
jgi:hypothetical protein